jgi:hypothetical protein
MVDSSNVQIEVAVVGFGVKYWKWPHNMLVIFYVCKPETTVSLESSRCPKAAFGTVVVADPESAKFGMVNIICTSRVQKWSPIRSL